MNQRMNGRVQVAVHWCHAGFELDGPERRVCRAGTWSDRQPVCLPSSGFVDENRFQKKTKKNHNVFDILGPTRIIESRNRPNVQRIVPSEKELVRRPKTELKRGRLFLRYGPRFSMVLTKRSIDNKERVALS